MTHVGDGAESSRQVRLRWQAVTASPAKNSLRAAAQTLLRRTMPPIPRLPLPNKPLVATADALTPRDADLLTPRFLALLESELPTTTAAAPPHTTTETLAATHREELRSMWQQALYRQAVLEAENDELRRALHAAQQQAPPPPAGATSTSTSTTTSSAAAAATPTAADETSATAEERWNRDAAGVQNVLGALPPHRPGGAGGAPGGALCPEWMASHGLSWAEISACVHWLDARLIEAAAASFPRLRRLMSTPLLCRETAYECAGDLLRKRDALLLLRDEGHGAVASVAAAAAAVGAELRAEEVSAAALRHDVRRLERNVAQLLANADFLAREADKARDAARRHVEEARGCVLAMRPPPDEKDDDWRRAEAAADAAAARLARSLDELERICVTASTPRVHGGPAAGRGAPPARSPLDWLSRGASEAGSRLRRVFGDEGADDDEEEPPPGAGRSNSAPRHRRGPLVQ